MTVSVDRLKELTVKQKEKIKKLERQNQELKKQIQALENRIQKLEKTRMAIDFATADIPVDLKLVPEDANDRSDS